MRSYIGVHTIMMKEEGPLNKKHIEGKSCDRKT